uniref:FERM domain-containing protein n=1 Tax=Bursaphelenchus xylophilus TaxID=6326 RepID=A0A1I7SG92_BURXY
MGQALSREGAQLSMVSILRSFSQRFNKKRAPKPEEIVEKSHGITKPDQINTRKQFLCKIILLDGTDLNIALSRKAVGQEAYDKVFNHLDLDESDYFGLQYTDAYNVQHWLDPWKKIRKQISIGRICTFRFQVKFFSSEPSNLRSEFTKYQFFLQLKNDIRTGKLKCPKSAVIPMAALQLQSECGDFNPEQHHAAFVSEFRFHPEQDEEMEIAILEEWTRLKGRTPAEAEQFYLDHAKRLEFYGVELYEVLAKDGNRYMLGLTPSGVIVLDNTTLIGLLFWHFMPQFSFHNRHITIVLEEHISEEIQQHTFVFELASQKASKHVWKRAVEYHTFYRMKRHRPHRKAADQILRFRSTFEHRGRTEFENVNNPSIRRDQRSISFQRKPSQRYGPRQSHIQRLREERERKNQEARQRQLEALEQENNNVKTEDKQLSSEESRGPQLASQVLGSVQSQQEDVKQQYKIPPSWAMVFSKLVGPSRPWAAKLSCVWGCPFQQSLVPSSFVFPKLHLCHVVPFSLLCFHTYILQSSSSSDIFVVYMVPQRYTQHPSFH